jgi:hypothetical protein
MLILEIAKILDEQPFVIKATYTNSSLSCLGIWAMNLFPLSGQIV